MTKEELIRMILGAEDSTFTLDEMVIDQKCQEAASINNCGVEYQIDYLLERGYSTDSIWFRVSEEGE